MDYIEAFKNLRTNNKYGRKSPHKAILMLTVIELYEQNILTNNEIYYNDKLKSMFLKVWNRVLPKEPLFHPEAYLPFWYLQNDSFWHIVPIRGKEDILSLMRDTNIKPSESKLNDSVRCAELDEDLYFLMTIASGRSSLKRALLETYTQLSEKQIDRLAESADNSIDHSLSAIEEYEQILSSKNTDEKEFENDSSTELEKQFKELSDDLQITFNYEYYAFLKNHRSERDLFREVCPNVFALYDCIINRPIQRETISPSFAFIYDNFLSDLKIALMSENGSMELIDKIDNSIAILRGNIVEDDSSDEEKTIDIINEIEEQKAAPVYNKGYDDNNLVIEHVYLDSSYNIVKTVTTSPLNDSPKEEASENRKGKAWTQEEEERITHYFERGINTADIAERVGRTEVAIKARLAKLGLIDYTYGQDEVVAKPSKGVVYDYPHTFVPKGRLKRINEIAKESYDFLFTMAVVEFMKFIPQPTIITFDKLASMMIALAWEILNGNENIKGKEELLNDCIEFLIAESKEEMDEVLIWGSSRKTVFNTIKDFPMADVYEDTVDALIAKAPYNVLRAWISETDEEEIVRSSNLPSASCLYAIHPMKHNPYIDIKQGWKSYLLKENEELMNYYRRLYLEFLEGC